MLSRSMTGKKILFGSGLMLVLFPTALDAANPPRETQKITVEPSTQGFTAKIGSETLQISVCRDSVVHVVGRPTPSDTDPAQPWMLSATEACPGAKFQFSQNGDIAALTTSKLKVHLSLKQGNLSYSAVNGEHLLNEFIQVPRTYDPAPADAQGMYQITDRFSPDGTEAYYGLGQHQNGMFNYRGGTVELGQNNTDIAIPLLVSSKGYALMWNTASFTYVDNRFPGTLNLSSLAANSIDYFLIYGPEIDEIIHQYRNMTGHTPMLPKWAYGFFQSKDRYESQQQI